MASIFVPILLSLLSSDLFFFFFFLNDHKFPAAAAAPNPRLRRAYTALQAWKRVIYSDPKNFTADWSGPQVCRYTGVYCAEAPGENGTRTVAGVDLNGGDIAGFLPEEVGLLEDLALLHLNSNRFCGVIPQSLANLSLLFELDLSNNRFVGPFPGAVLALPALNYLDLRYNEFEGPVPAQVFAKGLDAVFLNSNRFTGVAIPGAGAVGAAVLVLAHNNYGGKLPEGIGRLAETLEELVVREANLTGCLPEEVGQLYKLRVLDVSSNAVEGPLPYSMAGLYHLEHLDLSHNRLSGNIPAALCGLPRLANFSLAYNLFCEEDPTCVAELSSKKAVFDDRRNCLPHRPLQRPKKVCDAVPAPRC